MLVLLASSVLAQTKVREGSQTQGALPSAQGGVPAGGTTGQALLKLSNTDYATGWGSVSITTGNLTDVGTDGISITGGTGAVVGAGTSFAQHVADSSHNGYLSLTDWTTFNSKQSALTLGNLTDAGTDGISVSGGTGAVVGSGVALSQHVADGTHNGYLSSADWLSFSSGAAGGTVTSFSAGNLSPLFTTSVSNPNTTPALSFSLSNAAAHTFFANNTGSSGAPSFTSFAAGTDYQTPLTFTTSLSNSSGTVTLLNDATPTAGAIYFYGQNAAGTKGWQPFVTTGGGGGGITVGDLTDDGTDGLVVTNGTNAVVGTGTSLAQHVADSTHNGYLASADFNTFNSPYHSLTFVVDGSGIVLGTGTKNPSKVPFGGTLVGWTAMCSPSGSVTADVLRAANGAGLPVTSIVGAGTKPAISSNVENSSTTFTSWTSTTLTAKDNLAISLSGVTTATYFELTLYYK